MLKVLRSFALAALLMLPFAAQAQQTLPYEEGFDGTSAPTGWTLYSVLASTVFEGGTLPSPTSWGWSFGARGGLSSTHAYSNIYGTSCYRWLVSPSISLEGVSTAQVSFDLAYTTYNGSAAASTAGTDDKVMVIVSADDGATWSAADATTWTLDGSGTYDLASLTPSYQTYTVNLNAYLGNTVKIAFYVESTESNNDNDLHIDNVLVEEQPTCMRVVSLAASNIANNSVTLTWADPSNGSGVTYTVMNGEDVVASNVTVPSYVITGLTANTAYTFSVIANCSATDASLPVSLAVRTACDLIATLPYSCGFEPEEVNASTGMPYCWTRGTSGSYPEISTSTTYARSGNCMWFYSWAAAPQIAVLPEVDLYVLSLDALRLRFYARVGYANNSGTLIVGTMSDPTDASTFTGVDTFTVNSTTHTLFTVNGLPATTDSYIAICYPTASTAIYIDDVTLDLIPSCVELSNLAVTGATANSITLTWEDPSNTGATYTVMNGSTEVASGLTELTYTVTGLDPNTEYTFSVIANCSATDASEAISVTGRTTCSAVSLPYFNDFEDAAEFTCWNMVNCAGGTTRTYDSYGGNVTSGEYAFMFYYNSNPPQYLISPELEGTDDGVAVTFMYKAYDEGYPESFKVGYSTTDNATTSFTWGSEITTSNTLWHEYNDVFPAGTKYVAIQLTSYDKFYLYIDDFSAQAPVSVTLATADAAMGSVDPEGVTEVAPGSEFTATATAEETYHFVAWIDGNGDTVSTDNPFAFTVAGDTALTAHFAINTYTVAIAASDATMGSVVPTADTVVEHGTVVNAEATPGDGFRFLGWFDGTDTVSTDNLLVLTVVSDTALTALFDYNTHTVSIATADAEMGSALPEGDSIVTHGESITVSATAAEGYHFEGWLNGSDTVSTDNPFTFVVESDSSLVAAFAINTYTLSLTADATMGSVVPTTDTIVEHGSEIDLTATAEEGYSFKGWIVGTDTVSTDNPYTITVVSDTALAAVFELNSYTVSIATADVSVGTVEPEGDSIVNHGESFVATATAEEGYSFVAWMAGADTISVDNPFTFTVVSDTALIAVFELNSYTVNLATADATMGSVEPAGDTVVDHGAAIVVNAVPEAGYHFAGWLAGTDTISTDNPLTLTVVSDSSLVAAFEANPAGTFTVSVLFDAAMGTVEGVPAEAVDSASVVTLTAVANEHYHFVEWSNGETTETIEVAVVSDTTLTATFAIDQHMVDATVEPAESGSVEGIPTEAVDYGSTVSLTAVPATGYHFVSWSTGETTETIDVLVEGDTTLTATFELNQYTISAVVTPDASGSVSGVPTEAVDHGTEVSLTAVPAAGYHFVSWSTGETTPTIVLTVESDTTLTATFEANAAGTYTVSVIYDATMGTVEGVPTEPVVAGSVVTLVAVPAEGYVFAGWSDGTTTDTLEVTVTGDITLTANFKLFVPSEFIVVVNTRNTIMGTVSPMGINNVLEASEFTATATAHDGYEFVAWISGNDTVSTDAVYTFTVESSITLIAIFTEVVPEVVYFIDGQVSNAAMGQVLGGGYYGAGDTVTLVAQAFTGYRFVRWDDGSTLPYREIVVNGDMTVTAYFETVPVDIDEVELAEVEIVAADSRIIVRGAEGSDIYVYDATGRVLRHQANATANVEIAVPATGVYLVKVGNAAAKRVAVVR